MPGEKKKFPPPNARGKFFCPGHRHARGKKSSPPPMPGEKKICPGHRHARGKKKFSPPYARGNFFARGVPTCPGKKSSGRFFPRLPGGITDHKKFLSQSGEKKKKSPGLTKFSRGKKKKIPPEIDLEKKKKTPPADFFSPPTGKHQKQTRSGSRRDRRQLVEDRGPLPVLRSLEPIIP
jgi:hypothetical protein